MRTSTRIWSSIGVFIRINMADSINWGGVSFAVLVSMLGPPISPHASWNPALGLPAASHGLRKLIAASDWLEHGT